MTREPLEEKSRPPAPSPNTGGGAILATWIVYPIYWRPDHLPLLPYSGPAASFSYSSLSLPLFRWFPATLAPTPATCLPSLVRSVAYSSSRFAIVATNCCTIARAAALLLLCSNPLATTLAPFSCFELR
ncbi:hypothetical protein NL676_039262 [Syzygium grande]|nr:hypothetical protein NL676_039262 [Syzygium grande]